MTRHHPRWGHTATVTATVTVTVTVEDWTLDRLAQTPGHPHYPSNQGARFVVRNEPQPIPHDTSTTQKIQFPESGSAHRSSRSGTKGTALAPRTNPIHAETRGPERTRRMAGQRRVPRYRTVGVLLPRQ